jgi:hypothetical protein
MTMLDIADHVAHPPGSKESLQRESLVTLVVGRLRTVPVLRAAIEQDPSFAVLVAQPRHHERDSHGRNWDIVAFQTGFVFWPQGGAEFRKIVDSLRKTFDMS